MSKTLIHRFLRHAVKLGTLEVFFADGDERIYGSVVDGYPDVAIRFTDKKVPRDIVLDPALGAAEAFMDGRLNFEHGDIMQLVELLQANSPWDKGGDVGLPSFGRKIANSAAFALEQVNNRISSKKNVGHHYDIGNALYELMLDPEYMQYSCGYWPEGVKTLSEAQQAKLAHIAAKLDLKPGQRVLDIGCGWGGMAIYLAQNADVTVLGITLSEEQFALAQKRAEQAGVADRVKFELVDYRDLAERGDKFDRIVSVGMFEHVGQRQFETYFRCCANLMTDDGVALIHTIGRFGAPGTTDAFTRKYIFPGGYIPALSETVEASEKSRLIATDIETLRLHYAFTLRAWYGNCQANKDKIVAMYDERFFRMWTFYLAGATGAFENGGMGNYQLQFSRNRRTLPLSRGYMAEAEAKMSGGRVV